MGIERSHGRLYPLVPRVDELPEGIPGDAAPTNRPEHDGQGRFAPGNQISRRGGLGKAGKTRLAARLGLAKLPEGSDFAAYQASAEAFRRQHCAELARTVGGGVCASGPSSLVASASVQLAWSRYLSDKAARTGDTAMALSASRLADASRNNLLSAHELCAKEAEARPQPVPDWMKPSEEEPEVAEVEPQADDEEGPSDGRD